MNLDHSPFYQPRISHEEIPLINKLVSQNTQPLPLQQDNYYPNQLFYNDPSTIHLANVNRTYSAPYSNIAQHPDLKYYQDQIFQQEEFLKQHPQQLLCPTSPNHSKPNLDRIRDVELSYLQDGLPPLIQSIYSPGTVPEYKHITLNTNINRQEGYKDSLRQNLQSQRNQQNHAMNNYMISDSLYQPMSSQAMTPPTPTPNLPSPFHNQIPNHNTPYQQIIIPPIYNNNNLPYPTNSNVNSPQGSYRLPLDNFKHGESKPIKRAHAYSEATISPMNSAVIGNSINRYNEVSRQAQSFMSSSPFNQFKIDPVEPPKKRRLVSGHKGKFSVLRESKLISEETKSFTTTKNQISQLIVPKSKNRILAQKKKVQLKGKNITERNDNIGSECKLAKTPSRPNNSDDKKKVPITNEDFKTPAKPINLSSPTTILIESEKATIKANNPNTPSQFLPSPTPIKFASTKVVPCLRIVSDPTGVKPTMGIFSGESRPNSRHSERSNSNASKKSDAHQRSLSFHTGITKNNLPTYDKMFSSMSQFQIDISKESKKPNPRRSSTSGNLPRCQAFNSTDAHDYVFNKNINIPSLRYPSIPVLKTSLSQTHESSSKGLSSASINNGVESHNFPHSRSKSSTSSLDAITSKVQNRKSISSDQTSLVPPMNKTELESIITQAINDNSSNTVIENTSEISLLDPISSTPTAAIRNNNTWERQEDHSDTVISNTTEISLVDPLSTPIAGRKNKTKEQSDDQDNIHNTESASINALKDVNNDPVLEIGNITLDGFCASNMDNNLDVKDTDSLWEGFMYDIDKTPDQPILSSSMLASAAIPGVTPIKRMTKGKRPSMSFFNEFDEGSQQNSDDITENEAFVLGNVLNNGVELSKDMKWDLAEEAQKFA